MTTRRGQCSNSLRPSTPIASTIGWSPTTRRCSATSPRKRWRSATSAPAATLRQHVSIAWRPYTRQTARNAKSRPRLLRCGPRLRQPITTAREASPQAPSITLQKKLQVTAIGSETDRILIKLIADRHGLSGESKPDLIGQEPCAPQPIGLLRGRDSHARMGTRGLRDPNSRRVTKPEQLGRLHDPVGEHIGLPGLRHVRPNRLPALIRQLAPQHGKFPERLERKNAARITVVRDLVMDERVQQMPFVRQHHECTMLIR